MSVSLSEVLAGAEAQAVPLSAECAGYLVLAAADQAALSPRRVQAGEVCLLDDGAVRLLGGAPADDATAEGDLRELLGGLLSSASSSTAGLLRARRRASGAGVGALLKELERALIPVNRAAARRALARLARETVRAKDEGRLVAAPPPAAASVAAATSIATVSPSRVPEPVPAAVAPVVMPSFPAPAVESAPLPPVEAEAEHGLTQVLPRVEVTERLVLPLIAPTPAEAAASPEESETRPEPVVLRASTRPPPMPDPPSVVVAEPAAVASTGTTPVLGTVLGPSLVADEPRLSVAELAQALATEDELDIEVEVTFSEDESTIVPDDVELILLADDGEELERTEPSPLAESASQPEVAAESAAPAPVVAESAVPVPVVAESVAEAPEVDDLDVGTVLPPWVTSKVVEAELSPLPNVVVPGPRESNVDDLLRGMESEAMGLDDLRSGLKSLAGLEPTPPPPGSVLD